MTQRVVNYTYGTGNPVLPDGSIDVRDGIDNLQSMDVFMNAPEDTYNQRDGEIVRTVAGMNNEFDAHILNMGFTRVGTFSAGATLTNPRQTLLWDVADGGDGQEYGWSGSFPKVVTPGSTPLTTGGIAVGSWMSRFDPGLRIQVRESLRRSYAEAGYNLVAGSFESGGTLVNSNDVLLHEASGKAFSGPAGVVAAGTDPTSGGFVDRSLYGTVAEKVKSKLPFSGAAEVTQLFNNSLYLSARQFYGVTGNGGDQTIGLQNAINAASNGGVLFIDNGVYGVSDYLKIPSKTKIVMAPYAVIIRLTATRGSTGEALDAIFLNDSNGSVGGFSANTDIHIEGGVVDGNIDLINNSATLIAFGHCSRVSVTRTMLLNTGGDYHAIEINATKQATIRDCVIDNAGGLNSEAIQIDNSKGDGRFPWFGPYDGAPCTEIHIDNCAITNFGWAVATHAGPAEGGRHSRIKITNCTSNTWRGGIRSYSWTNTKILNCTITGSNDRGSVGIAGAFLEWVSDSDLSDTVISGCTISGWNNGGSDIRIVGSSSSSTKLNVVRISNCACYPATNHSLYVKNAFGVTISGNDFAQPFTAGVPSVEIYDGDKISFTGNRVTGGARLGNSASVGTVSVAASGNHISGTLEVLPTVAFSAIVGNRASVLTNTSTALSNVVASNSVGG